MASRRISASHEKNSSLESYAAGVGAPAAALVVALLLQPLAGPGHVDLVFLTAVVAVAARFGFGPSLVAAAAAVLAYNFFFIPPIHSFAVADTADMAALLLFLVFAAATIILATGVRIEARVALHQARIAEALYRFSRTISDISDPDELATVAAARIGAVLRRDVMLLLPDERGVLEIQARSDPRLGFDRLELEAAQAVWRAGEWAGRDVMRIGGSLIYPLRTEASVAGLAALSRDGQSEPFSKDEERMFAALAEQVAGGFARIRLSAERDRAQLAAEGERLRTALFSSLSHDLRTPLATITGAATALKDDPNLYDAVSRAELVATLHEESERMARFVNNLLDMSQLEAGDLSPAREAVDLGEVVATALRRTDDLLDAHRVEVDLAPDLPLLLLDGVLLEQALVNLLDNAAKYAPQGSTVSISGRRLDRAIELLVADEGSGLASEDVERVFDKFYRATRGDRQRAGTGLGLAISRGFVEAMGGTVRAAARSDRSGAVFTIAFPSSLATASSEEASA